jgi:hypothetical protein
MYYRGASAAVVVFDVTNRESFEGAKSWVKELQRRGDQNVVIALAGNKADMKEKRLVDVEEAKEYAKENGLIYMDTSAKSNLNVKEIFAAIGEREGGKDAAVRSFHHAAVGEQRAATRRTDSSPARPRCRTTRSSPQPPSLIHNPISFLPQPLPSSAARKLPRNQREKDAEVITNLAEETGTQSGGGGGKAGGGCCGGKA